MKEFAVYVRLSLAGEDETSLERQRETGTHWAEQHHYVPVVYQEPAGHRSGKSEKARPEWRRLKADIATGRYRGGGLWVADIARASRNVVEFLSLLDLCLKQDTALVSEKEHLDTNTAAGRLMATVLAAFNQFYVDDISERQKRAIAHRKSKGLSYGGVPFGLERDPQTQKLKVSHATYCLSDGTRREYLSTVKQALKWYAESDRGLYALADKLNQHGYRWRAQTGDRPVRVRPYHLRKLMHILAKYRGLLDEALLAGAERRAVERSTNWESAERFKHPVPLLWKLVRCEVCGGPYTTGYNRKNRRGNWRGRYVHANARDCDVRTEPAARPIDAQVLERVNQRFILDEDEKDRMAQAACAETEPVAAVDHAELERRKERLKRMYRDGFMDEAEYEREGETIRQLEDQAAPPVRAPRVTYAEVRAVLDDLPALLRDRAVTDPEWANLVLRELLEAVYLQDKRVVRIVGRPPYQGWFDPPRAS